MTIRLGILGATGRMGKQLLNTISSAENLVLGAAITKEGMQGIGEDVSSILNSKDNISEKIKNNYTCLDLNNIFFELVPNYCIKN